jgi:hypothetical protein
MAEANPYWIDDGFRQLRLGLVWQRLAWLTRADPHPSGAKPTLGARLHDQVLKAYVQPLWQGVLRDLAERVEPDYQQEGWELPEQTLDALRETLTRVVRTSAPGRKPMPLAEAKVEVLNLLRACLDEDRQDTPSANLPPIVYGSREIVAGWLQHARALDRWHGMAADFTKPAPTDEDLSVLGQSCHEVSTALQERRGLISLFRFVPGQSVQTFRALEQAVDLLDRCSHRFADLSGRFADNGAREQHAEVARWVAFIGQELKRSPAPHQLCELQELLTRQAGFRTLVQDLGEFNQQRAGEVQLPALPQGQPARAKAVLAILIVEHLDASAGRLGLTEAAWDAVGGWLGRWLAESPQPPRLVRSRNTWPTSFTAQESEDPLPRVEATGLVLGAPEDGVVLRPARLRIPRPPHPLEDALRQLRRGLKDDLALAELCDEVADEVHRRARDPAGPLGSDIDSLARLWRLAHRVSALPPALHAPAALVLQQLDALGYGLTPAPPLSFQERRDNGIWLIAPTAATTDRGVALRLPGDRAFFPAVWLAVPRPRAEGHPLLRWVRQSEGLLAGLRFRFPDWPGWAAYHDALWELAYRDPADPQSAPADRHTIKRLLSDLYPRTQSADDPFRELLRGLVRVFTTEMKEPLTPAFDLATLRPMRVTTEPADGTKVALVASDLPFGDVIEIEEFGVAGSPGRLRVSGGRELAGELEAWLRLPAPTLADAISNHPLVRWHQAIAGSRWQPGRFRELVATHQNEFRRWVATPPGAEWFDRWVRTLTGDTAARAWYDALLRDRWFRCIPALNFETGAIVWPRDVKPTAEHRFDCSDSLPAWQVVPGTEFYATAPERARGTISVGRRTPGQLLDVTLRLAQSLADTSDEALARPVESLVRGVYEHVLLQTPPPSGAEMVLPLLDAVMAAARAVRQRRDAAALQRLDAALQALRAWGTLQGLTVLPAGYTLAEGLRGDVETASRKLAFGKWGKVGSERLLRFGLRQKDRVVRPCEIEQCAGPAPTDYAALCEALASGGGAWASLLAELQTWPQKAVDGTLTYAIQDFFIEFWERAASAGTDDELVGRVTQALHHMLETDLQLTAFYPASTLEYPDGWLEIRAAGPIRTGHVLRMLRPGLKAPDGAVQVKAIVEAE